MDAGLGEAAVTPPTSLFTETCQGRAGQWWGLVDPGPQGELGLVEERKASRDPAGPGQRRSRPREPGMGHWVEAPTEP